MRTTTPTKVCREGLDKSQMAKELITGILPQTPKRPPNYPHSGHEKVRAESL